MRSADVDLADCTQYGTGGSARWFATPRGEEHLVELLRWKEREGIPAFLLGSGTNTLFGDGRFDGLVIATTSWTGRKVLAEGCIETAPGTSLRTLIGAAIVRGWQGLEGFVGIPGTIGGAVWGNAGGAAGGIAPLVEAVRLVERDGTARWILGETLPWRYRHSGIGDRAISAVRLRLRPGAEVSTLRAEAKRVFDRKRRSQPLTARTAGCVFRNPPEDSAGRLIEAAGLKGARIGDARVSEQHANFIINEGGASSAEISRLIDQVRRRVAETSGIWLEREIIDTRGAEGCRP